VNTRLCISLLNNRPVLDDSCSPGMPHTRPLLGISATSMRILQGISLCCTCLCGCVRSPGVPWYRVQVQHNAMTSISRCADHEHWHCRWSHIHHVCLPSCRFTRDAKLLRAVGSVLLEPYKPLVLPSPTNSSSPATAQTTGSTPASPAAAPSSQGPNTAGAAARSSVINNASTSADASHNRSHKGSGVRWLIATDAFDMAEGPTAEALRSMVTHHMAAIIPVLGGAPPVEVQVRGQLFGLCSKDNQAFHEEAITDSYKALLSPFHRRYNRAGRAEALRLAASAVSWL
jgi:hypothetical protein